MKSTLLFRLLFLVVAAGLGAAVVQAEDVNAVKSRMEQRLGAIDALKDRQVVGENNRGYVEGRGALSGEEQKIVSDENADRRAIYAAVAAQTRTDADTVGKQRAQQLAQRSKRGVWVQDAGGEWRQKT